MNFRIRDLVLVMLWRCRGCYFHWSHLGTHQYVHGTSSQNATKSLCLPLWLPPLHFVLFYSGSLELENSWPLVLPTLCQPNNSCHCSLQPFLSISRSPPPITVCLTGVTHLSHRRCLQTHLPPPMFDLWRSYCHVAVKYGFWNSRSDYPGFCFNLLIESH